MRLIVCGGRDFEDEEYVDTVLDSFRPMECIITGGAPGADTLAAEWAKSRGVPLLICPAHWDTLGRAAGPIRNGWMITIAKGTHLLAFPGGRGTANMRLQAVRSGLEILHYRERDADAYL
jgi:hypothetical protein